MSKAMHSGQRMAAQKRREPRKVQTMAQQIQMEPRRDQTRAGPTQMDSSSAWMMALLIQMELR